MKHTKGQTATSRLVCALALAVIMIGTSSFAQNYGTYGEFASAQGYMDGSSNYIDGAAPHEDMDEDGGLNREEYLGWTTFINGQPYVFSWDSNMVAAFVLANPTAIVDHGPWLDDPDSDNDGVGDWVEMNATSDPLDLDGDSDDDGLPDRWEIYVGLNCLDDGTVYPNHGAIGDPDGDGLSNAEEMGGPDGEFPDAIQAEEYREITCPSFNIADMNVRDGDYPVDDYTLPIDFDSDDDRLIDSYEYERSHAMDPSEPDEDADADPDEDGLTSFREQCIHPLLAVDYARNSFVLWYKGTETDGYYWPVEGGNGAFVGESYILHAIAGYLNRANYGEAGNNFAGDVGDVEWGHPCVVSQNDVEYYGTKRWTDPTGGAPVGNGFDTDEDMLPDGWEVEHGLNPLDGFGPWIEYVGGSGLVSADTGNLNPSGGLGDPDGDTLLNYEEYFGQDGYRCDLITGTGDETSPWITRAINRRFETAFLIYMHAETADTSVWSQVMWADSAHRAAQSPNGYFGVGPTYGDSGVLTNAYHPVNYPGFFDPIEFAATNYVPISGVPPMTVFTDTDDATWSNFNPFATAIGDLYFLDVDSNSVYNPGIDDAFYDIDGDSTYTGADYAFSTNTMVVGETNIISMLNNVPLRWPIPGYDTDDDGLPDNFEIQRDIVAGKVATSPVHPSSPFIPRSCYVTTNGGLEILTPDTAELGRYLFSRDWTIECWAYLRDNDTNEYTGAFILGEVGVSTLNRAAYEIGVSNSMPYASFETLGGKRYEVSSPSKMPKNQWVHLGGVWDHARNSLSLYIDGMLNQSEQDLEESSSWFGASIHGRGGSARLAVDMVGTNAPPGFTNFAHNLWLDEVRIWGVPRTSTEIADNRMHLVDPFQGIPVPPYAGIMEGSNNALFAYYPFDDSGTTANDYTKRAAVSLTGYSFPSDALVQGAPGHEYLYLDRGFGIDSEAIDGVDQAFTFDANQIAPVIGMIDGERGAFDSDGDNLPDAWELMHELNPFKLMTPDHLQSPKYDVPWQTSEGAERDDLRDMESVPDGLDNMNEYWARTNPRERDTDEDAIPDMAEDFDMDGLPNLVEIDLGSRPDLADTDDDGYEDSVEQARETSPTYSLDPAIPRAVWMDGFPGTYLDVPPRAEMSLDDWSIDVNILPAFDHGLEDGQGAYIFRRGVEATANGLIAANFEVRVVRYGANLYPEARYTYVDQSGNGHTVICLSTNIDAILPLDSNPTDPFPNGDVSMVTATFGQLTGVLSLYLDTELIATQTNALTRPPISGQGPDSFVRIGEGYRGFIEEVRLWSTELSQSELQAYTNVVMLGSEEDLVAYFSINDGGWPSKNVYAPVLDHVTAPAIASNGVRYLVAPGGTLAFAGHDTELAEYVVENLAGAWFFDAPVDGERVYDIASGNVLQYIEAAATWSNMTAVAGANPTILRSVRWGAAPAVPVEGDTWYSLGSITTYESTNASTTVYADPVFSEGTMLSGAAADGDFAMFISRNEYYRRDSSLVGVPAVAPGWLRWGPAVEWLSPARTAVEAVYASTNQLPVSPRVGETFLLTNTYELITFNGYGYTTNTLLDEDRLLDVASGIVYDFDQATTSLIAVADGTTDGGGLFLYLKDAGSAVRSSGVSSNSWRRWGYIPATEDFTNPQNWNKQWDHAALRMGGAFFLELSGELQVGDIVLDSDGDGMPDAWELANSLDPNDNTGIHGADGDPDNDGFTNLEEYQRGTDPWVADILSWSPSPLIVQVGDTASVTITRPPQLIDTDLEIDMYSSDNSLFTVGLASATIPQGATGVTVQVSGISLAQGMGSHNGILTVVSDIGGAWIPVVVSNGISLDLSMDILTSTNVVAGDTATMEVRRRRGPGSIDTPLTVLLQAGDASVRVPASVTIQSGSDIAWFTLTGVSVDSNVLVQASAVGYPSTAVQVGVTPPTILPWVAGQQVSNIIVSVGATLPVELRRSVDQVASSLSVELAAEESTVFSVNPGSAVWSQNDVASTIQIIGGSLSGSAKLARSTLLVTSGGSWTQAIDVIVRPGADLDFDGLLDETEILTGTDLTLPDSDGDGISDYDEDSDGDGISNGDEQDVFGTHAGNPDSDDDGFSDGDEIDWREQCPAGGRHISSPLYSRSPIIQRSMMLSGSGLVVQDPAVAGDDERFDLSSWTIECWVMPTNGLQTGDLLSRFTQYGETNYVLRLSNNLPIVEFSTDAGNIYSISSDTPIPAGEWTHLAATWDPTMDSLSLYVDLVEYRSQLILEECAQGYGTVTIGEGVQGLLDELRVWNIGRGSAEIAARWLWFGPSSFAAEGGGLVAWYPFDDGENTSITNLRTSTVVGYGAEDYAHRLDWDYSLNGVQFSTNAVELYGIVDEDGDDLPDWWEAIFFGGDADPDADTDHDTLLNSLEYELDTNPRDDDTNADGVGDAMEDADGDGLSNGDEVLFGTDPTDDDSDDDDYLDGEELDPAFTCHDRRITSPLYSRSPLLQSSAALNGSAGVAMGTTAVPGREERFSLSPWTIEGWVMLTNNPLQRGAIIERTTSSGQTNFFLGVEAPRNASVQFTTASGNHYSLVSPTTLPLDEWVHLAGVWDAGQHTLTLYVNAIPVRQLVSLEDCAQGVGSEVLGRGLVGAMDELRIWNSALDWMTLVTNMNNIITSPDEQTSLVANYRFDDRGATAEDYTHSLNWDYALSGIDFTTNVYADLDGIADEDGDGIADWWEDLFFDGDALAVTDEDVDSLNNAYEYLTDSHPGDRDTDDNGIYDGAEDYDSDGLANVYEQVHSTDPANWDSDDDTFSDGREMSAYQQCPTNGGRFTTSPLFSASPHIYRSAVLTGVALDVPELFTQADEEKQGRLDLDAWTVECWYMPTNGLQTGSLMTRETMSGRTNFALTLQNNIPSVEFTTESGERYFASATAVLPGDEWSHIAGTWDPVADSLRLFIDGQFVASQICIEECARGGATVSLGESIQGLLDDVRVWAIVRTDEEIRTTRSTFAPHLSKGSGDFGQSYDGIEFFDGAEAFADQVIRFIEGDVGDGNGHIDPNDAVGTPNSYEIDGSNRVGQVSLGMSDIQVGMWNQFDLGLGITNTTFANDVAIFTVGHLQLEFKDVLLTGSGDSRPELFIFETASHNDPLYVFISEDGDQWEYIGLSPGGTYGFDIDNLAPMNKLHYRAVEGGEPPFFYYFETKPYGEQYSEVPNTNLYRYVWLVDAGYHAGDIESGLSTLGMPGADIDAVGIKTYVEAETMDAWYPFDDGGVTAEDFMSPLDWDYAIENVTFSTNVHPWTTGSLDTDGDGIPDWWELLFFGDIASAIPDQDVDGDGLTNADEFELDTNPHDMDSDANGVKDGYEDADGDGLSNRDESKFMTDPLDPDTDDDGFTDGEEIDTTFVSAGVALSCPRQSLSPVVKASMVLNGTPVSLRDVQIVDELDRYALPSWGVECWFMPTNTALQSGALVERVLVNGQTNFSLGITTSLRPYVEFSDGAGNPYRAVANDSISMDEWVHLAGSWDPDSDLLTLFVNSVPIQNRACLVQCAQGGGMTRLGDGVIGLMDEMRIWSREMKQERIATSLNQVIVDPENAELASYYRFDDRGVLAEDMTHPLQWDYAISGVTFDTNEYVDLLTIRELEPDSIPVWWSMMFFGEEVLDRSRAYNHDPSAITSRDPWGAAEDPDEDGLDNRSEWLLSLNPTSPDTDGDVIVDGDEDHDDDGVGNREEVVTWLTDPAVADSDDDGLSDGQELAQALDPTDANQPYIMRYLHNDGSGWVSVPGHIYANDPNGTRFDLKAWTVETTVRLDSQPTQDVVLVRRQVRSGTNEYSTFEVGIDNLSRAYTKFDTSAGEEVRVVGYRAIATNEWVHLSARCGLDEREGHSQLALFVDGAKTARDVEDRNPISGQQSGDLIMALNLHGDIDEVRVWNRARRDSEILNAYSLPLHFGSEVARMGSLDPGDGHLMRYMGPNIDDPIQLTNWTIEAWVKSSESGGLILEREAGFGHDGERLYNYKMHVTDSGVIEVLFDVEDLLMVDVDWEPAPHNLFEFYRWGTIRILGRTPINDDSWHHVAFVVSQNEAVFYIDGVIEEDYQLPLPHSMIEWHLAPGDISVRDYMIDPPIHNRADMTGRLTVGLDFVGWLDELRLYSRADTLAMIKNRMHAKATPDFLASYYHFDDIDLTEDLVVPDGAQPDNELAFGLLLLESGLLQGQGYNAPIKTDALSVLQPKLAAYWSFDDGRTTNGTGRYAVEDHTHQNILQFAGTLMPDTNSIDFGLYTAPGVADPSHPFADYWPAMAYPPNFAMPTPAQSPWVLDSDGDGMSDGFEVYYRLDPNRALSPEDPDLEALADMDGDNLFNLYEFYAGTDPTFHDSDTDGVDDGEEDSDGDTVPNIDEQAMGSHPGRVDTDDDGITDGDEGMQGFWSNPGDSMAPKDPVNRLNADRRWRYKSMVLDGMAHEIPKPPMYKTRLNAGSWTIEGWVRVTNGAPSGRLISYVGETWPFPGSSMPVTFYEMGLTNGSPYVEMTGGDTLRRYTLSITNRVLVNDQWIHLAGVFDQTNNTLGLYYNGMLAVQMQVFESSMSGSASAQKWPGRGYLGGPGVLGSFDEVRLWSVPRNAAQIASGLANLVQVDEQGLLANYRFDDGRRSSSATVELADGYGANDGQGAEDFVHRLGAKDLESSWLFSVRDITFDYENAVLSTRDDADDLDHDNLPDWWESMHFNEVMTFYRPIRDKDGWIISSRKGYTIIHGAESPAYHAALLGWGVEYTPAVTIPDHRCTEQPDGMWMFKDVWLDDEAESVELRIGVTGSGVELYVNGELMDLTAETVQDCPETFTTPEVQPVESYYIPTETLERVFRQGRNRLTVRVLNEDGEIPWQSNQEYFNLELLINGSEYLIRRGDDEEIESRDKALWWMYAIPGSMAPPPNDSSDRAWTDKDYAIDMDADTDGDGLLDTEEFLVAASPTAYDSDGDGVLDSDEDFDGDGLSDSHELYKYGSDPRRADTDDDGYSDGEENASWLPATAGNYGIAQRRTSPLYSLTPRVHRALELSGNSLRAPKSRRFMLEEIETDDLEKPSIIITSPENGETLLVRYVELTGSIASVSPVVSAAMYVNNRFIRNISLENNEFSETVIIGTGQNTIRIVATDEDGVVGENEVQVVGDFPAAAIRVTQMWDVPGDLDTWVIDPQGQHMGWTASGPGLPTSIDAAIPGSMLDIDDIMGNGPENITVEADAVQPGTYQIWMNNYSHLGNPMSTVQILVGEGTSQERLVQFGPREMAIADMNGGHVGAWWHVTSVTWPGEVDTGDDGSGGDGGTGGDVGSGGDSGGSGSDSGGSGGDSGTTGSGGGIVMDPAGTLISAYAPGSEREIVDTETGFSSVPGWTIEGWVKPMDDNQTGALASYYDPVGMLQYVVGLNQNSPFVRVKASGGLWYEANAGPLTAEEWSHVAFVYSRDERSLRVHIDGVVVSAIEMLEEPTQREGELFVDDSFTDPTSGITSSFTDAYLDELRFWRRARNGGLIAAKRHDIVSKSQSLVAAYHFDDGGRGIEDATQPLDRSYDLGFDMTVGIDSLPDLVVNAGPGPDGRWGTGGDDVGGALGADGHNDRVVADEWGPVYGDVDSDLDGLPNRWEILFFGAGTDAIAGADEDDDGLTNYEEFRLGTNPFEQDSDNDSIFDGAEDYDGDGLANAIELANSSSPLLPDTDDDGILDSTEVVIGTEPDSAISPWSNKVLEVVGGSSSYLQLPKNDRYRLESWTIGAWVRPDSVDSYATIITYSFGAGVENYHLGIDTNSQAVLRFTSQDFSTNVTLRSTNMIPLDTWTHIGGTFDAGDNRFSLSVNNELDSWMSTAFLCADNGRGPVFGAIGMGFDGLIEDVKIASPDDGDGSDRTVAHFAFDDGTHTNGTSGVYGWNNGQVQNFASDTGEDWKNHWLEAATLIGNGVETIVSALDSPDVPPPDRPGDDIPEDTDGDGMVDFWEQSYPYTLLPFIDDSREDPDGDGWDNLSEYMWSFQTGCTITNASDPTDPTSYPTPRIGFEFKYGGVAGDGMLHVEIFNTASRDGLPNAVFEVDTTTIDWTQPLELSISDYDEGHIHQGQAWLFAFIDRNGDGLWNDGEPGGTEEMNASFEVGWGDVPPVTVGLTDEVRGYPRFDWTATPDTNGTRVVVRDLGSSGAPIVIDKYLFGDRSYFHEGDYRDAGRSHLGESTYQWFAGPDSGVFTVEWGDMSAATLISPVGNEHLVIGRNELKWSMAPGVAQVRIEICAGYADGPKNYAGWHLAPYRETDGTYRMDIPRYAGDVALTNGQYYWQLTTWNPDGSEESGWEPFTVDLSTSSDLGPFEITGLIRQQDTPVTSGYFVVQAFRKLGFSGEPEAEAHVAPSTGADTAFRLRGLRGGTNVSYYVRAFLDQNGNDRMDYFESFGYVIQTDLEGADWCEYMAPRRVWLQSDSDWEEIPLAHRDTDHDGIWDAWEYQYFSSLAISGSGVDSDGDGLNDDAEYNAGSSPIDTDSDNDGLSDGDEVSLYRSSPVSSDGDSDGLPDWAEVSMWFTDPSSADSDGDSLSDLWEIQNRHLFFDANDPDEDSDGLESGIEVGWDGNATNYNPATDMNPFIADTDGDWLSDFDEYNMGLDPLNPDDDSDSIPTYLEISWDGITNAYDPATDLNPAVADTDGDSVSDLMEIVAGSSPLLTNDSNEISLPRITVDGSGNPVISWDLYMYTNAFGANVMVNVQRSLDNVVWTTVGSVLSDGDTSGLTNVVDSAGTTNRGNYRLMFEVVP